MTRQRPVILEELKNLTTHPTADELYSMVRRRLPRISLGTVYRNLEILSEMGLAQKLESAGAQRRYGGDVTDLWRAIRTKHHTYRVGTRDYHQQMFDNRADPMQLHELFHEPDAAETRQRLHELLIREIVRSGETVPDYVWAAGEA